MRIFLLSVALCGAICITGCFSLESEVSKTNGQEHVVAKNYGWSLFNCLPLCCGNVNAQGRVGPWAFFRDDVTLDKMHERFLRHAAEKGRPAQDVCCHSYDSVMIYILSIPIPHVFTYKEIQISGVLK